MALESANEPTDEPLSNLGSEPLVPILQIDAGQLDPVALGTWHQALSNTLSVEVPHDLMGLWLYPSQGGVALLGPPELAADDLAIPIPSPHLTSEQISVIEKTVLDAGYGSVTCLPIRFGKRDVALLLVADLQPRALRAGRAGAAAVRGSAGSADAGTDRTAVGDSGRIGLPAAGADRRAARDGVQGEPGGQLAAALRGGDRARARATAAARSHRAAGAQLGGRRILPPGRAPRRPALGRPVADDQPGASRHRRGLRRTGPAAGAGHI